MGLASVPKPRTGPVTLQANFGPKAVTLLDVLSLPMGSRDRQQAYQQAQLRFGDKAIRRKYDELHTRGYITAPLFRLDLGGHVPVAVLTPRGRDVLILMHGHLRG